MFLSLDMQTCSSHANHDVCLVDLDASSRRSTAQLLPAWRLKPVAVACRLRWPGTNSLDLVPLLIHYGLATGQAEEAERLRLKRERDEAHRFTVIRVATSADMQEQIGQDTFFDLVDFSKVCQTL